jgi:UDP-N-acetylglucosamine--N-acetylmuramyl-(pentapeptide) pyrophosphoryl-undecaprenol N-acetylglucosamine transferase
MREDHAVLRVLIAAGGTAGHVVPALAVARRLTAAGAEVVFVGGQRAEAELVPAAGYELRTIRVEGLSRTNPLRAARAALRSAAAVRVAHGMLGELRPAAVLGGGGYVAGPVGLAALARRVPLVLTEADSHLGLTNRLLARRARRVCLAFPIDGRDGDRYLLTGRPVPAAIFEADRGAARRRFGIDPERRCLLVFGGSLGSLTINRATATAFGSAPGPSGTERDFHVLHIAGRRDHDEIAAQVREAPLYTLVEYLPDLGEALAASDLVLARSGGSIFELTAAGRPAVLVPYPYASAGHQRTNARWMADAGAAIVIEDSELDAERLRAEIPPLLDPAAADRLEAMSAASRSLARPDAAERIAAEILGHI